MKLSKISSIQLLKKSIFATLTIGSFIVLQSFSTITEDVKIKGSTINWVGTKVTGSHEGTVNLQSGYLNFDNKDLVGGGFVIDMTSIVCTDLSGKGKASIEGHLKSDDFFSVDDFPSASLKISDVKKLGLGDYMVTADITIKGTTQAITFKTVIEDETAKATLIIDRTEFGIIYKSGNFFEELADKAIYDEFEMTVNLKF